LQQFLETSNLFPDIIFANIDCNHVSFICASYLIVSVPRLVLFSPQHPGPREFTYERTKSDMTSFLIRYTNRTPRDAPVVPLHHLSFDRFTHEATRECNAVLLHVTWCRLSRHLLTLFSAAADVFRGDSWVHLGIMNCEDYWSVCNRFDASPLPKMLVFLNGSLVFNDVVSTLDGVIDIVNEKCGTFRKTDGSFADDVLAMDEESAQMLAEEREKYRKAGFDIELVTKDLIKIETVIQRKECSWGVKNRLFLKKVFIERILTELLGN
jgi:hypothetical protein